MIEQIDAHHHFWRYSEAEYGWIGQDMEQLRRNFLPADLEPEIAAADVQGVITVQARQTTEETAWLLSLAEQSSFVRGVIGWAPIASPEFPSLLLSLVENRKLKGLRHVLQDEPDQTYMLQPCFQRGISSLKGTGLVYDILIYEAQLPTAALLVDSHPDQIFVLDHLGKPKIRDRELSPWRERLREIAARRNVYCKFSGLATEADWARWTMDDLRPYFDVALECFGAGRLLAGSDWPVCTMVTGYQRWWQTLRELVSALSPDEQDGILGRNAKRVYRLEGELK
jgi:L-fuconolactonase